MTIGPIAWVLVSRRKQDASVQEERERHAELSRKYTNLLEEVTTRELPSGPSRT
uniref:Uncharacterized protein n=1 Tax=Streptomyces sp. NBC_00003 TaxID=2903608 RepID=A0AAU2VCP4_9ACTN